MKLFFTPSHLALSALAISLFISLPARAQYDPAPRQILHAGVDSSLHNQGPMGAYLFYYWNLPNVPTTNEFLRLAIAPVYVDGELSFAHLLGEQTDFAVGAFGGLYANSYQEVDAGNWKKDESFDGMAAASARVFITGSIPTSKSRSPAYCAHP